jgi:hypothetical protein
MHVIRQREHAVINHVCGGCIRRDSALSRHIRRSPHAPHVHSRQTGHRCTRGAVCPHCAMYRGGACAQNPLHIAALLWRSCDIPVHVRWVQEQPRVLHRHAVRTAHRIQHIRTLLFDPYVHILSGSDVVFGYGFLIHRRRSRSKAPGIFVSYQPSFLFFFLAMCDAGVLTREDADAFATQHPADVDAMLCETELDSWLRSTGMMSGGGCGCSRVRRSAIARPQIVLRMDKADVRNHTSISQEMFSSASSLVRDVPCITRWTLNPQAERYAQYVQQHMVVEDGKLAAKPYGNHGSRMPLIMWICEAMNIYASQPFDPTSIAVQRRTHGKKKSRTNIPWRELMVDDGKRTKQCGGAILIKHDDTRVTFAEALITEAAMFVEQNQNNASQCPDDPPCGS